MNAQDPIPAAAIRMTKHGRFVGWGFLIIGSSGCLSAVPPLFDPRATIMVNGVPTSDFTTKLGVAVFVVMFPAIGAFLALTPKRKMQAWWEAFMRFTSLGI